MKIEDTKTNQEEAPLVIDGFTEADWPEAAKIYQAGIDTEIAAFRPEVPTWQEFDKGHLPHSRLAARIDGRLAGWAALSPASDKEYYRGVTEVSIYIAPESKGKGAGKTLLSELIKEAERHGVWTIEAKILAENEASLALHRKCGFRLVGTRSKMGRMKNGRWHDVCIMEYRSQINGWD